VEDLLFLSFRMFLMRAAMDIGHAHWFIVDASEENPHSLARFMHISHELLMVLLKGCQLTLKNGSVNTISSTKIEGFIQTFRDPALEFTSTCTVIDSIDKNKKMYHLLCIGRYRKNENFTFSQQIAFKKEEKRRVPNFWESCHHESMKDTLFWFIDITPKPLKSVTVQSKDQAPPTMPPPKRNPGVIDTPTQIQLGVSLILETINLEHNYLYMHSLGISIKTDWNICKLQHELEKQSDEIKLVNLGELISGNDRV